MDGASPARPPEERHQPAVRSHRDRLRREPAVSRGRSARILSVRSNRHISAAVKVGPGNKSCTVAGGSVSTSASAGLGSAGGGSSDSTSVDSGVSGAGSGCA